MKRFNILALVGLLAALIFALPASAQVVSLNSTTISSAMAATDRVVCLTSYTYVTVPAVNQAGSLIYVGSEAMTVTAAGSTTGCYQVLRNNRPAGWASGTAVYYGAASSFYTVDPPSQGACVVATMAVRPWVNMTNRVVWDCVSSKWTAINGYPAYGLGLTAVGPVTAGTVDVGSAALPFRYLYFAGGSGTPGTNNFRITGTSTSGTRVFTLPDFSATAATLTGVETLTNKTLTSAAVTTDIHSTTAGVSTLGTAALPFATMYLGGASGTPATNNFLFTGTSTSGTRTITFPDASITVPGTVGQWCGTTNACAATAISTNMKVVAGITANLDGASPSVAAVTGISPAFTSTTSYSCSATIEGATQALAAQGVVVTQASASAVTFTSANSSTAKVHYVCVGY